MTRQQIDNLISRRAIHHGERVVQTIETFISWVIICERFTYKIKRPVQHSFLNFSTIERRKNFCLQEYYLNRQLAGDMYVDVLPVTNNGSIKIGGNGVVKDYAVRMKTLNNNNLMSTMLSNGRVSEEQIKDLARAIAVFHSRSRKIYIRANFNLADKFNDLAGQTSFLSNFMSEDVVESMQASIARFQWLINNLTGRLIQRVNLGFFRDCHGDLHSGNVFLIDKAVPFDRIEFDSELREIDVLNEIAFMCMDLEYFGQPDLSRLFFETYNLLFPAVLSKDDENLFLLYKAYRANVCAKVSSLKARDTTDTNQKNSHLRKVTRYLSMMGIYLDQVERNIFGVAMTTGFSGSRDELAVGKQTV
jgi:uncharacterized protein